MVEFLFCSSFGVKLVCLKMYCCHEVKLFVPILFVMSLQIAVLVFFYFVVLTAGLVSMLF